MSRFKFIIVSKDSKHYLEQKDFDNIQNVDVEFVKNNSKGLPKLYNEFLEVERCTKLHDFVTFMHGDVKLDIAQFINNLDRCKETYDVFGLCGTEVLTVSQTPLNWYTGSRPTPHKRWGCVTHGEIGNQMSFFSSHSPEVIDHEVACIDGLCIALGPKVLNSDFKFDEDFDFDQYDTACSLDCVINYHFKIGVLVHKELQHYSVGKGILDKKFLVGEKKLREKYGF